MNIRLQNQLNMVGACLTVANSNNYKSVWTGKPPADFATDLVSLQTNYDTVTTKAAQADAATGGGATPRPRRKPPSKTPPTLSPARWRIILRKRVTWTALAKWT